MINILSYQANTNPGTTDFLAAVNSAIASISETDLSLSDSGVGGPLIFFPPGRYYFSDSINLKKAVILEGCDGGMAGGHSTILVFAANKHGIIINAANSDMGEEVGSATTHAAGTQIRNLQLIGSGAQQKHGIYARARFAAVDVGIARFGGHGILVTAGGVDGGVGNANNFRITGGRVVDNRRSGLRVQGGDANAGVVTGVDFTANGDWGVDDRSFLGNLYVGCHADQNGLVGGAGGRTLYSVVTHGGKVWSVRPEYENDASTQVPGTGLAWIAKINGENVFAAPAWSTGTQYLAGGAYCSTSSASYGTILHGCYSEGAQSPSYLASPAMAIHGIHGAGINGIWLHAAQGRLISNEGLRSEQYLGGQLAEAEFGSRLRADEIFHAAHPTISPSATKLRFAGTGIIGMQNGNSPLAWLVTTDSSPYNFGRGTAQVGKMQAPEIFLGNANNSRAVAMGSEKPTGTHAKGEIVFNDGTKSENDAVDYWRCTSSGPTSTWVARP